MKSVKERLVNIKVISPMTKKILKIPWEHELLLVTKKVLSPPQHYQNYFITHISRFFL